MSSDAVVFIHGVGDHTPGASVRAFVEGLLGANLTWSVDAPAPYISLSDRLDSTHELRRLHVWSDKASGRPGTDFFELYWADLMPPLSTGEGLNWLKGLARRPYKEMPPQMRPLWLLTRGVVVIVAAVASIVALIYGIDSTASGFGKVLRFAPFAAVLGFAKGVVSSFMRSSIGDAARYLSARPDNVAARQAIRQRGLDLLAKLRDDGRYDRIVIVGHSLGSVIGYDLVNLAWVDGRFYYGTPPADVVPQPALDTYEAAAANVERHDLRVEQADVWAEQRAAGSAWLISDLITLGSPLAHAQLVMTSGREDLRHRQLQRELTTCPPVPDVLRPGEKPTTPRRMAFAPPWDRTRRVLHLGAPFAATRWTNLYFPTRWGFSGDLIGGPVAPAFGRGVVDQAVTSDLGLMATRTPKAHSNYWTPSKGTPPKDDALTALRTALGF